MTASATIHFQLNMLDSSLGADESPCNAHTRPIANVAYVSMPVAHILLVMSPPGLGTRRLTFARTQDQPRRNGTVMALHRADMRVKAVLEGEVEFRRRKVERVMGSNTCWWIG